MDLVDAFNNWKCMGNKLREYDQPPNKHVVEFIEDGIVVGKITAIAGEGIRWDYPQSLLNYVQAKEQAEQIAAEIDQAAFETDQYLEQ